VLLLVDRTLLGSYNYFAERMDPQGLRLRPRSSLIDPFAGAKVNRPNEKEELVSARSDNPERHKALLEAYSLAKVARSMFNDAANKESWSSRHLKGGGIYKLAKELEKPSVADSLGLSAQEGAELAQMVRRCRDEHASVASGAVIGGFLSFSMFAILLQKQCASSQRKKKALKKIFKLRPGLTRSTTERWRSSAAFDDGDTAQGEQQDVSGEVPAEVPAEVPVASPASADVLERPPGGRVFTPAKLGSARFALRSQCLAAAKSRAAILAPDMTPAEMYTTRGSCRESTSLKQRSLSAVPSSAAREP